MFLIACFSRSDHRNYFVLLIWILEILIVVELWDLWDLWGSWKIVYAGRLYLHVDLLTWLSKLISTWRAFLQQFWNRKLKKQSLCTYSVKDVSPLQRIEVHLTTNIPVTTYLNYPHLVTQVDIFKRPWPISSFAWCNRNFQSYFENYNKKIRHILACLLKQRVDLI